MAAHLASSPTLTLDICTDKREAIIEHLETHAPAFKFKLAENGQIIASLFRCEISSHFQPLVEAGRTTRIFGHQSRLAASEQGARYLSQREIIDVASSCKVLPQLQLMDVALHVANYFSKAPVTYSLFVSPAVELFDDVLVLSATLAGLLEILNIQSARLVVRIPDKLLISVKATGPLLDVLCRQGFGIAVGLPKRFDLLKKLEQQYRIGFVLFDPAKRIRESNVNHLIRQINSIGSSAVCIGILDPRGNDKLAEAGAGLLIGHGIAPPSAHIFPGLLPPFPWAKV